MVYLSIYSIASTRNRLMRVLCPVINPLTEPKSLKRHFDAVGSTFRLTCEVARRLCGRTFRGHICLDGFRSQPDEIPWWDARGPPRTLVIPPSTTKSWPFTKLLSSLARNKTAWACSIASPNRPVGKWISRRWRFAASSPSQSCRRGVLARMSTLPSKSSPRLSVEANLTYFKGAGHRALNLKPSLACTIANSLVNARTAPLLAV